MSVSAEPISTQIKNSRANELGVFSPARVREMWTEHYQLLRLHDVFSSGEARQLTRDYIGEVLRDYSGAVAKKWPLMATLPPMLRVRRIK